MTISRAAMAFPKSEYLRRLAAVKAEMQRRELDALVVASSANLIDTVTSAQLGASLAPLRKRCRMALRRAERHSSHTRPRAQ